MQVNDKLNHARKAKCDEFYTQYEDIEAEMKNYTNFFKGKTVYCNCDDPRYSNFFRYFAENFHTLHLRRLIASCYIDQQMDLFSDAVPEKAFYVDYDGTLINGKIPSIEQMGIHPFKENGDFRSKECIDLLKQADVVCSNPPFSLAIEYFLQLVKYKKKFIILGNVNAISYKEIFRLIQNNQIWLGESIHSGDRKFIVPDNYPLNASNCGIDENGNKYIRVNGIRWFTNIDYESHHEPISLTKHYNPKDYPQYDNYNAIEVSRVEDIPMDYDGVMGVPITFLDKYCPEQFEIVKFRKGDDDKDLSINGKYPFARILIKKQNGERYDRPYLNGKRMFARIMIRSKLPTN